MQSCFGLGYRPSEDEIYMWNEFMCKRGWNDELSETPEAEKKKEAMLSRSEIKTMFQFIDADEGRLVNGSHLNGKNGSTRQKLMVHHCSFRFEQPDSSRSDQPLVQHV